jgi:hypothetical protein
MENMLLRPEINSGCTVVRQPAIEDPSVLLESLRTESEHVLRLFSSAMAGQKEREFTGMIDCVSKTVNQLTRYTQSANKEFVKEVSDRVGDLLSTICAHVAKEQVSNVDVATSLLNLGEDLADLHEAAAHRFTDGVLGLH